MDTAFEKEKSVKAMDYIQFSILEEIQESRESQEVQDIQDIVKLLRTQKPLINEDMLL